MLDIEKRDVLLFAAAAELAACDVVAIDVGQPATAGEIMDALAQQVPQLAGLLPACRLAVDRVFVTSDFPVRTDAQLALIPPVSGG